MSNNQDVETIIIDTVLSVLDRTEYVSRLSSSITRTLSMGLLGNDETDGIKIINDKKGIILNIHIIVYYGINIPQLSYDIQMNIQKELKEHDIKLQEINIIVEGIDRK